MSQCITRAYKGRRKQIDKSDPKVIVKTILDAYLKPLPARFRPTTKGRQFLRATLHASLVELTTNLTVELQQTIEYKEFCPRAEKDYECLGGAFFSLCQGSSLKQLCTKIPFTNDILIHAAKRMGLKQTLKHGGLFGIMCWNLPPLAVKLLQEPKDSDAFPDVLQRGGGFRYMTDEYLFWSTAYGPSSRQVLEAMMAVMTVNEMIDRIDFSWFTLGRADGKSNLVFVQKQISALLASDPCYLELTKRVNFELIAAHPNANSNHILRSHSIQQLVNIQHQHQQYRTDIPPVLTTALTRVGLLSCFAPLLQSFLF
jgi:hypothetical protein